MTHRRHVARSEAGDVRVRAVAAGAACRDYRCFLAFALNVL
jgi:hypothetical protein